jgi:hypothetical protein
LVQLPAGLKDQPAGGGDVDLVVGDHLLGHPEVGQPRSEYSSLRGAADGDLLGAASDAEPAHAVRHPDWAQPDLGVAVAEVDFAWSEFVPFLDYDVEIRKVICSTNAIESLNARYRRAVKAAGTSRPSKPRSNACIW